MLDRIWVQIARKWPGFDQKHRSKFAKFRPRVEVKVACLEGEVIKNCVLCCSRPVKFKLIIFGIIFDI